MQKRQPTMTSYENRQPPEGINTSSEHPLKEFVQLLLGLALVVMVCLLIINVLIHSFVHHIPFSVEKKMADKFQVLKPTLSVQQQYLQELADRLLNKMDLDDSIDVTVHYDDSNIMNAFATVGGHLFFYKGLIDTLESEQELAAVMAHEIAHIQYRHPIIAFSKGITFSTFAAFISGASGSSAGDWLMKNSINLSLLQFSREQELEADALAIRALYKAYGNINGAEQLFKRFSSLENSSISALNANKLVLFRSHPFSNDRWQISKALATTKGWPLTGPLTPLAFPNDEKIKKSIFK